MSDRSPDVQAFVDLPPLTAPRGGIRYRPSPFELAREQYAAQLVVDVRDAITAELMEDQLAGPYALTAVEAAAAAVVKLVYPTLAQLKDRDSQQEREQQAADMLNRAVDADGDGRVELVAGLLRDLRRLYDDAQNVREQYGAECRKATDELWEAQQQVATLLDVVRRVRQATRHVRTGRG